VRRPSGGLQQSVAEARERPHGVIVHSPPIGAQLCHFTQSLLHHVDERHQVEEAHMRFKSLRQIYVVRIEERNVIGPGRGQAKVPEALMPRLTCPG